MYIYIYMYIMYVCVLCVCVCVCVILCVSACVCTCWPESGGINDASNASRSSTASPQNVHADSTWDPSNCVLIELVCLVCSSWSLSHKVREARVCDMHRLTRACLTAGALGPFVVSLNTNKSSSSHSEEVAFCLERAACSILLTEAEAYTCPFTSPSLPPPPPRCVTTPPPPS